MSVVLPPGYQAERTHRYPVVYALHGYSIGAEQWIRELHVPQTIEGALANWVDERPFKVKSQWLRAARSGDHRTKAV